MSKRNVAILLALLGGSIGLQKFYTKQIGTGVMFCIFSFTAIPFFLSIVDIIRYATMTDEAFEQKYGFYRVKKEIPRKDYRTVEENKRDSKGDYEQKAHQYLGEGNIKEAERIVAEAIKENPRNAKLMFLQACIEAQKRAIYEAYIYLESAIENGYNDKERINRHWALEVLRTDEKWAEFVDAGYKVNWKKEPMKRESLLENINKHRKEKVAEVRKTKTEDGNEYDEIFG